MYATIRSRCNQKTIIHTMWNYTLQCRFWGDTIAALGNVKLQTGATASIVGGSVGCALKGFPSIGESSSGGLTSEHLLSPANSHSLWNPMTKAAYWWKGYLGEQLQRARNPLWVGVLKQAEGTAGESEAVSPHLQIQAQYTGAEL